MLQALTTRYPEPDMIEVAVASFETMLSLETSGEGGQPVSPADEPASPPPLS